MFKKERGYLVKKLLGLATLCIIFLATAVTAFAATYGVSVSGKTISLTTDGKTTTSYNLKSSDITVRTSTGGDLQVCFYDTNGKYSAINLKSQKSVAVSGTMNSLNLQKSLYNDVTVSLPAEGSVGTLTVAYPGTVSISGSVKTMTVSAAADVNVLSGGTVTNAKVNSSGATLLASPGSTVSSVSKTSGAVVSGDGIRSNNTTSGTNRTSGTTTDAKTPSSRWDDTNDNATYRTKLVRNGDIYARMGDRLGDLQNDISSCFTAYAENYYDNAYNNQISGNYYWNSASDTAVEDGATYTFRFVPHDTEYRSCTGAIRVHVS